MLNSDLDLEQKSKLKSENGHGSKVWPPPRSGSIIKRQRLEVAVSRFTFTFIIPLVLFSTFSLLQVIVCGAEEETTTKAEEDLPNITLPLPSSLKNYSYCLQSLDELAHHDLQVVQALLAVIQQKDISAKGLSLAQSYLESFEEGSGLILTGQEVNARDENHKYKVVPSEENWRSEAWLKSQAEKISNNAVSAYKLISRTAKNWKKLYDRVFDESTWPLQHVKKEDWPSKSDVIKAANGIFELQVFYNLSVPEFAAGRIQGIPTGVKMDIDDCLAIGRYAYELKFFAQSFEWLELAKKKIRDKQFKPQTAKKEKKLTAKIIKYAKETVLQHEEAWSADQEEGIKYNPRLYGEPLYELLASCGRPGSSAGCQPRRLNSKDMDLEEEFDINEHDQYRHFDLCQGQNFQSEDVKARLFCWREFHAHPVFTIGPAKMEFLSIDPDVVHIYDIAGPKLIHRIQDLAKDGYKNSLCGSRGDLLKRDPALSQTYGAFQDAYISWIYDHHPQFFGIRKLIKNIEAVSRFKASRPEDAHALRLVSYTFAGNYKVHHDKQGQSFDPSTFRMATFLLYFSDVESGGYTAFPRLGFGVRPVKGSALLWFNIYGNDTEDDDLLHGSCTAVLGRKSVATKWIQTYSQFASYPCPLKQETRFRVKVNGHVPKIKLWHAKNRNRNKK